MTVERQHVEAEEIRSTARRILRGERAVYGDLLRLTLECIESAIRRACRGIHPERAEDYINGFLEDRIENGCSEDGFLGQLAKAERPMALLWVSAGNYAKDRASKDGWLSESKESGELDGNITEDLTPPPGRDDDAGDALTEEPLDGEQEVEGLSIRARRELDRLPEEQQRLLRLCFVHLWPPMPADATRIASLTGWSESEAWAALQSRMDRQRERFEETERQARVRGEELLIAHRKLDVARKAMAVAGDGPGPSMPVDSSRAAALLGNPEKLRLARPEERRGLVDRFTQRVESIVRRMTDARDAMCEGLPGGMEYEEVALLMGRISPGDPPEIRDRAINTLTVQVRRILKSIRGRVEGRQP